LENFEYPFDYYEEKLDIRLADSYNFKSIEEDEEFYKNKKFLLDGAFVSIVWDYAIEIQLCFKDPNDNFSKTISIVDDHRFPCFEFTLDFSHLDRVDNKIKCDKEMTFNQSTVVFCDIWDEETNPGEIKYEKLNKLTIEPEKCYISEWTEYVLMDKALKLIVNCARYLSPNEKNIKNFVTNQHTTNILKI